VLANIFIKKKRWDRISISLNHEKWALHTIVFLIIENSSTPKTLLAPGMYTALVTSVKKQTSCDR